MFLEKPDPSEKRPKKRRKRWTIPPLPVGSAEDLEGVEVLEELPDEAGLELFQRLRDVLFWISTPEGSRARIFVRERVTAVSPDVPQVIRESVGVLRRLTVQPAASEPVEIGTACVAVSSWAYDAGLLKTAVAFAHVAARVLPDDPEVAFGVARATRDSGRFGHADAWFQRALGLARRARNAEIKARVYIGWGLLDEMRAAEVAAKAKFEKALATATAASLPSIAAHAHQFMIPFGTLSEGFAHAVAAAQLYAPDDLNLPRLASDTGALFSEHGHFSVALTLYEAARPFLTRTADLVACYANIGRASAALGLKQRFTEAWTEVERLSRAPIAQFHADSLVELATGAVTLRYWKYAAKMVAEATAVARQLGGVRTLRKAEELAACIEHRSGGDTDRPPDPNLEEFTADLCQRLSALTNTSN